MNNPPTLDRFETALLEELRTHVATRPAVEPVPEPRGRHRRRWAAGLAAAAAAATAYVVVSPGGPAVSPAYAVSLQADGDVVVTVHRLEDADGLEHALRDHGIDAEVDFGRLTAELAVPDGAPIPDQEPPVIDGTLCAHEGDPATLTQEGDDWVLRIPADSPLQRQPVFLATDASGALAVAWASESPFTMCTVWS